MKDVAYSAYTWRVRRRKRRPPEQDARLSFLCSLSIEPVQSFGRFQYTVALGKQNKLRCLVARACLFSFRAITDRRLSCLRSSATTAVSLSSSSTLQTGSAEGTAHNYLRIAPDCSAHEAKTEGLHALPLQRELILYIWRSGYRLLLSQSGESRETKEQGIF